MTGDIRYYGLLKTIGVTPRQLRRIIRQQALLLCGVGCPLGLIAGWLVGSCLVPVVLARTSLETIQTEVSSSPLIFAASALFAVATVLLSCGRPGRMAAKVSPVEAVKIYGNRHFFPEGAEKQPGRDRRDGLCQPGKE